MKSGKNIFCIIYAFLCGAMAFAEASSGAESAGTPANGFALRRTIKVGFFAFEGYHNIDKSGVRSGYGYDYLQSLLPFAPWTYEYSSMEHGWDEMLPMLESGEIDLLTSARKTPEREMQFGFSDLPLGESGTILTVCACNKDLLAHNYRNWDGLSVGMVTGSTRNLGFAKFAKKKGFSYKPVYYSNANALIADLHTGNKVIDAALTSDLRTVTGENIIEKFDVSPFYIMVRKDDTNLLAEVNRAMRVQATLRPTLIPDLRNKYYKPGSSETVALSAEEMRFVEEAKASGRVFNAVLNPDRRPLSYYEDGEIRGLLRDILDVVIARTGLNIKILPLKTKKEYLDRTDDSDVVMILDVIGSYSDAETDGVVLTLPYYFPTLSILRRDHEIASVRGSIAMLSDSYIKKLARDYIPADVETLKCDSYPDMISMLLSGKCDSAFMYTASAEYLCSTKLKGMFFSEYLPTGEIELSIGVKTSADALLSSILCKAAAGIDKDFAEKFRRKYVSARVEHNEYSFIELARRNPLLFAGVPLGMFVMMCIFMALLVIKRRRDHRVATVVRELPLRYFVIDDAGKVLLCGLGEHSSEFKSNPEYINELPDKNVVDIMRSKIANVLVSGHAEIVDFEYAGRKRTAIVSKMPRSLFGRDTIIWVSQDTTILRDSIEREHRNMEFFKQTLNSIGDAVIATDAEGRVILINPVAERMLGVTSAAAEGRRHEEIFKIVGMDDNVPSQSPLRRALETGKIIELANHTDLISADGKRYNISDSAGPIFDYDGKLVGAILVFRDVTEDYRRRAEMLNNLENWEQASQLANITAFSVNSKTRETTWLGTKCYWPQENGSSVLADKWVLEADKEKFHKNFYSVANGTVKSVKFEYRALLGDRIHTFGLFIRKDSSSSDILTGLIQDITDRVSDKKEKDAMRALWDQTISLVPAMFFVKNADDGFRYIQCNKKFAEFIGKKPEDVVGKTDEDLFPRADDLSNFNEWDHRVMVSGVPHEFNETIQDSNGYLHHIRTVKTPSKSESGVTILIGMSIDVTEIQEMARAHEVISETFRFLFSNDDSGGALKSALKMVSEYIGAERANVWRIDKKNNVVRCVMETYPEGEEPIYPVEVPLHPAGNPDWYENLPWTKDGDLEFDAGLKDEKLNVYVPLRKFLPIFRHRKIKSVYLCNVMVDGVRWGNLGLITECNPMRKLSKTDRTMLKMTAHAIELFLSRKQNRTELERALVEAQSANKAKSLFLATMSHEIRTPLNAVIGFAELLGEENIDAQTGREYIKNISFSGKALLQLINDVLDISKLEAGQVQITKIRTDFVEFCQNIKGMFQHGADQKKLQLNVRCDTMPSIYIDQQRMRQILFNIIGNSVKFTEKGSVEVDVSFEQVSEGIGTLHITVSDTGIGISEEDQKTLFNPFVQAERQRGTKAANSGSGLGLSISDKLVTKMGGTITLKSKLNEGSQFFITIPDVRFDYNDTTGSGTETISFRSDKSLCNVLVVDDSEMNRKVLMAMLKRLGVNAMSADSGAQALELLKSESFDFVLTDLLMPEMDGEKLASEIRLNSEFGNIPIAVVTADSDKKLLKDGLFDKVLHKPFTLKQLGKCIFGDRT